MINADNGMWHEMSAGKVTTRTVCTVQSSRSCKRVPLFDDERGVDVPRELEGSLQEKREAHERDAVHELVLSPVQVDSAEQNDAAPVPERRQHSEQQYS